jgi:DNA repair protein RadA/Sms
MAKEKEHIYFCKECGYETKKWMGKCPGCNSWNSFSEELVSSSKNSKSSTINGLKERNTAKKLEEIKLDDAHRIDTGLNELNRVLGGGLVAGSVVLLGGDPGIGKSTILLQVCNKLSEEGELLYISGEESSSQIKMRAERIGINSKNLSILSETEMDIIESEISKIKPKIIIVDSVQTLSRADMTSAAGSVSQVREVAASFTYIAKTTGAAVFLVGHVTKEGALAGPRVLEHIVDTVLYFEGDRYDSYRILRAVKNRFGSTNEIGVFEMKEEGFEEVLNPSGLFINEEYTKEPGCGITCILEGTRPVLVEIQALVSESSFGNPRRMSAGIDTNRLSLLSAVIEKKGGLRFGNQDIFLNVIGGLKIEERTSDLLIVLLLASSLKNKPLQEGMVSIGEVSLTGEVRNVSNLDKRISECKKLGFKKIIVPASSMKNIKDIKDIEIIPVKTINEAIQIALI